MKEKLKEKVKVYTLNDPRFTLSFYREKVNVRLQYKSMDVFLNFPWMEFGRLVKVIRKCERMLNAGKIPTKSFTIYDRGRVFFEDDQLWLFYSKHYTRSTFLIPLGSYESVLSGVAEPEFYGSLASMLCDVWDSVVSGSSLTNGWIPITSHLNVNRLRPNALYTIKLVHGGTFIGESWETLRSLIPRKLELSGFVKAEEKTESIQRFIKLSDLNVDLAEQYWG